jgi:hypothetical protein
MPNEQPEIADGVLDRTVELVKTLNDKRAARQQPIASGETSSEQTSARGAAEDQRLRLDLLACEVDLLRFDLGVQVQRQAKLVALAIARERFERVLTTDATDGHG